MIKIIAKFYTRKLSEEHKQKLRNKIVSEETRLKMSIAGKGRKLSEETRKRMSDARMGDKNPNYGKHRPDSVKSAISKAQKGRVPSLETRNKISCANKGEKNGAWKGGISFEPYCPKFNRRFREYIRDKFNRVCFICGKHESENIDSKGTKWKLEVHHIDYDKVDICNGKSWPFVPLCLSCHCRTQHNRWYWFNLLINYWIKPLNIDYIWSV